MNAVWLEFLHANGAILTDDGLVERFTNSASELAASKNEVALADLSWFGLIRFRGEDSCVFLNNLLSSDIKGLSADRCQYSSFSTPKGRMLATFLLWRDGDDYVAQVPRQLREAMQRKLSMYVLRSKVKVDDASDAYVLLSVHGPKTQDALRQTFAQLPAEDFAVVKNEFGNIMRLPNQRFQLSLAPEKAQQIWTQLSHAAKPVGHQAWQWSEIRSGTPWVVAATQEQFVPQMANMELIGGVSFTKGCYPGQEIVARTQYLGKLKRRTYLVHVDVEQIAPGEALFSPEMGEQVIGLIANTAPSPGGGFDALAVIQTSSLPHGVHLGALSGPRLTVHSLPYTVE